MIPHCITKFNNVTKVSNLLYSIKYIGVLIIEKKNCLAEKADMHI